MLYGLKLAWNEGYRRVILETDSLTRVNLIKEGSEDSPYANIIHTIRQWLSKDWDCELVHTWREGNACADCLAKWSHQHKAGITLWNKPPDLVKQLFNDDVRRVASPRLIRL